MCIRDSAELEARFGKANVRDDGRPGAEGDGTVPVLTVFPDDAKQRLLLVLDPEPVSYTHLDVYKRQPPRPIQPRM